MDDFYVIEWTFFFFFKLYTNIYINSLDLALKNSAKRALM